MGGWYDEKWDTEDESIPNSYARELEADNKRRSLQSKQNARDFIASKKKSQNYYELPQWYREKIEDEAK